MHDRLREEFRNKIIDELSELNARTTTLQSKEKSTRLEIDRLLDLVERGDDPIRHKVISTKEKVEENSSELKSITDRIHVLEQFVPKSELMWKIIAGLLTIILFAVVSAIIGGVVKGQDKQIKSKPAVTQPATK